MAESNEETHPRSPEETLADIQDRLQGETAQTRLRAIKDLQELTFSSPAILRRLEEMAIQDKSKVVREAARAALASPAHRYIHSRTAILNSKDRKTILDEIAVWESQGLINPDQADVLRKRYDFDLEPVPAELASPAPLTPPEPATVKETASEPAPPTPRPGLTQTLLSETSIKIALYLGAFFVIAAAAILAALVEAARLPILLGATALFAGGAVITRSRLPQPSFALFIVFSFLLPTDANVLADVLNLSSKANAAYWFGMMAVMALIWSFGTWFYASRLFSLAAFVAGIISVVRLGEYFEAEPEIYLILLSVVTLLGLGGTYLLKRWRSAKFSLPLFIVVQISQLGLIAFALVAVAFRIEELPTTWNLLTTSFWLLAMIFYVLSDLVFPFMLFPWLAIAMLYPLPINLILAFDTEALPLAIAAWAWGFLLAIASELSRRIPNEKFHSYELPSLTGSLLIILTAISIGYVEILTHGFYFTLASAILFAVLQIFKPRIYVWITTLLLGLVAYFTFYALPFMESSDVFIGYQVMGASLLLLLPDLFLTPDFLADKAWRWPLRALGGMLAFYNLALILPISTENLGAATIIYTLYAIFFSLYALKFNTAWLAYLATTSLALALLFALRYFEQESWLLLQTILALLYYLNGFLFRRNEGRSPWSNMLRYSGLGLGSLVILVGLATSGDNLGWYALVTALLFAAEMFSHRASWAEAGLQLFLAISIFKLLTDINVEQGYLWLGISLALLGTDLILAHVYLEKRVLAWGSRGFGALAVVINTLILLYDGPYARIVAICFAAYALFFFVQTLLYRMPLLGYAFTLYSLLTVIYTLKTFGYLDWALPSTLLGIIFYATGYFLSKRMPVAAETGEEPENGIHSFTWPFVLWTSGLGVGLLTSLIAPFQDGLAAAIPPAVTATMVAIEAFERRDVWLGFPANALYLMAYFILLIELEVDEPQFFSITTAALGMLMHYLLIRAGSRTGAFITGMVSQLVLLSTTYIQFFSTERLVFFFALFFQSLVVLGYGIVIRSRSLVITPLAFLVLSVLTVLYGLLQGILTVVLIGCTGILLLMLGILAVLMRDRLKQISERFSDWSA